MGEITQEGAQNVGNIYLANQLQNANLYLGLFTNDITEPLADQTLATIVEPIAADYARATLVPASWVVVGEIATYPEIEFSVVTAEFGNIYGCFLATTVDSSGKLVLIDKFSSVKTLDFYGDRLAITPRITIT